MALVSHTFSINRGHLLRILWFFALIKIINAFRNLKQTHGHVHILSLLLNFVKSYFVFFQKCFDWQHQILLKVKNVVVHIFPND